MVRLVPIYGHLTFVTHKSDDIAQWIGDEVANWHLKYGQQGTKCPRQCVTKNIHLNKCAVVLNWEQIYDQPKNLLLHA